MKGTVRAGDGRALSVTGSQVPEKPEFPRERVYRTQPQRSPPLGQMFTEQHGSSHAKHHLESSPRQSLRAGGPVGGGPSYVEPSRVTDSPQGRATAVPGDVCGRSMSLDTRAAPVPRGSPHKSCHWQSFAKGPGER